MKLPEPFYIYPDDSDEVLFELHGNVSFDRGGIVDKLAQQAIANTEKTMIEQNEKNDDRTFLNRELGAAALSVRACLDSRERPNSILHVVMMLPGKSPGIIAGVLQTNVLTAMSQLERLTSLGILDRRDEGPNVSYAIRGDTDS